MHHYRLIQFRRYHDTLFSEFFWQLEQVIAVQRGRAQHRQNVAEKPLAWMLSTVTAVLSVVEETGLAEKAVSMVGSTVLDRFGQSYEDKRVQTLTPEYLSGQWEGLKEIVAKTAHRAVERYRYYLTTCLEEEAVELGTVSAQRVWEYMPRAQLSFTVDNMLLGILNGQLDAEHAAGVLNRAGIAYCDQNDQWHYALHPDDKNASFPAHGFMVLSEQDANTRIVAERYTRFEPSLSETQRLASIWSAPIIDASTTNTTVDNSNLLASSTSELEERLTRIEIDWLSYFNDSQDLLKAKLGSVEDELDSVKERLAGLEKPDTGTQQVTEWSENAQEHMRKAYRSKKEIQGLFGKPLQLEGQYINLQMLCQVKEGQSNQKNVSVRSTTSFKQI